MDAKTESEEILKTVCKNLNLILGHKVFYESPDNFRFPVYHKGKRVHIDCKIIIQRQTEPFISYEWTLDLRQFIDSRLSLFEYSKELAIQLSSDFAMKLMAMVREPKQRT